MFQVNLAEASVEQLIKVVMQVSPLHDISIEDPPMEELIQEIYRSAEVEYGELNAS